MRQLTVRLLLLSCFSIYTTQGSGALTPSAAFAGDTSLISSLFAANDASYSGGRGLITLEGISGMFLNPTSGTLGQGEFTGQYCAAPTEEVGTAVEHTAMVAYGVTDWFEIGAFGRISELDTPNQKVAAGGPLLRVRVLKEARWWPELSVGGMLREGNKDLTRRTLFVAFSKGVKISANSLFRTFRLHGGFRQLWQDPRVNVRDASIGYIGGELELPQYLYVVGEVSNKGDIFAHTPFSFGIQVRRPGGFAFTLGGIQGGNGEDISPYVGIGIKFQ